MRAMRTGWLVAGLLAGCAGGVSLEDAGPLDVEVSLSTTETGELVGARVDLTPHGDGCPTLATTAFVNGTALELKEAGGRRPTVTNYVNPSTFCEKPHFDTRLVDSESGTDEFPVMARAGEVLRLTFDEPGFVLESPSALPTGFSLRSPTVVQAGAPLVIQAPPLPVESTGWELSLRRPDRALGFEEHRALRDVTATRPSASGEWHVDTSLLAAGDWTVVVEARSSGPAERCDGFRSCRVTRRLLNSFDVTIRR
jgi:hypothetical protein